MNVSFSIPEHIKAELRSIDVRRECPICLDIIPKGELEITDCGHYFCAPCLSSVSNSTHACPTCRTDHHRVGRLRQTKRTTTTTTTTTTTVETEDVFDDGRYEVVGSEVYYILPNGDCYALDPHTLSMPHTFVGRISPDRKSIRYNTKPNILYRWI